jgi:hypothetical protein
MQMNATEGNAMNVSYQIRYGPHPCKVQSFTDPAEAKHFMAEQEAAGMLPRLFPFRNGKMDLTPAAVRPVYEARGK